MLHEVRTDRLVAVLGSSWVLGALAAVATWNVSFVAPSPGLDQSTVAASYLAAERGMHFGTQFVFVFGPLGFLRGPWLWYGGLAVLAFLYQAALHVALCVSLVWGLRRTLAPAASLIATFILVASAPSLDVPVTLAAVWCLAALSPTSSSLATRTVVFGGPVLGAVETLRYLRDGPVILVMCAITLLARKSSRRDLELFLGLSVTTFALLWFAAGQAVSNIPSFLQNSLQMVSGNSEAMGLPRPPGVSIEYLIGEVLISAVLVAAAALTSANGRTRGAAAMVIALASFSLYKEAAVRSDFVHTSIFYASAAGLTAALAFGRRRMVAVAALAAVALLNLRIDAIGGSPANFDAAAYARTASRQIRLLFMPSRRRSITSNSRASLAAHYQLPSATLRLLQGYTVHVDPAEVAVAWLYRLNWDPLPVIQDYGAYTSSLDHLDAAALRSPTGPQRILRENLAVVDQGDEIDGRLGAWDPPGKTLAMLCNYVPLQTTVRWEVLAKTQDRCGAPQLVGSIDTDFNATVSVPSAPLGGIVYAVIKGAGVSGLERIRTFLYRAKFRYAQLDGAVTIRLVPGTTGDGMLMRAAPGVDYPDPFQLSPNGSTIKLLGVSGPLQIRFYSMSVRATAGSPGRTSHRTVKPSIL